MSAYLESIAEGAIQGWLENKILPSLTMAQGALESGWGTSSLAKAPYYNNFGIKWTEGDRGKFDYVTMPTKEWSNGGWITINARFKRYDSLSDSVADHARFFTNTEWRKNNYRHVVGEKDAVKACQAVQNAGYATDPGYANKLIKIINDYNLRKYDEMAFQRENNKSAVPTPSTTISTSGNISNEKHLVICGHGQGYTYDPGAVNSNYGYKEAEFVRELADEMSKYSKSTTYLKDKNVYAYGSLASDSQGYDTVTELHFNAFNKVAKGTEVLIHSDYEADDMDKRILNALAKYFTNRGFKKVSNIANVNIARNNGINYRLVEVCFIDNDSEIEEYRKNLSSIAKDLVSAIENVVAFVDNSVVKDGKQELSLFNTDDKTYTVKPKDTLWKIATEHGLTVAKLREINNIQGDLIRPGQVLVVKERLNMTYDNTERKVETPSQVVNNDGIDKMIQWFKDRLGKVTYSMTYRNGPSSYDCSSAVYSALKHAGFKTQINYLGNTETLFKEKGHLLKEISRSEIKRGDIFVSGTEGASLGSYGHTGVVYANNQIIHCTYPKNGIAITPIDGWTGSPTRWFRIVGTETDTPTLAQESVKSYSETTYSADSQLVLPSDADRWRVYPVESSYIVGEEVGFILPSKFGGLTYDILGWLSNNVAKIKTETYGIVGIYTGSETGAKIVKKSNLSTQKVESDKGESVSIELQKVENSKGTIAPFAKSYLSGKKIPDNVRGNTYTIIGTKKVQKSKSRLAYNIEELNEWVLEQDILESYASENMEFDYNSNRYPGVFGSLSIGMTVRLRPKAKSFVNGEIITEEHKSKKYRVLGVVKAEQSYSKHAYRLSGLDELVLEQDIIETWKNARPSIKVDDLGIVNNEVEEVTKDLAVIGGNLDNGEWKDFLVFDDTYVIKGNDIRIGYLNIGGEPIKNQYLIGDNEYSGVGVFGDMTMPLNAIKFNMPKEFEYCALIKDVGFTRWTNSGYSGSKDTIITEIKIRKVKG